MPDRRPRPISNPARAALALASALLLHGPARAEAPCNVDDSELEMPADTTVAKAERCAAGSVGCCERLDWIRGFGPADLRDIPESLAKRVEKALARLCKRRNELACAVRPKLLVRLYREAEAIAIWSERCLAGGTAGTSDDCRRAGEGEERAGRTDRALRLYTAGCERSDGPSCRGKGSLLAARDRPEEARAAFAAGCDAGDAEACLDARRLSGRKLPEDTWEGLYRSSAGTLWLEDLGEGRIRVAMETEWANGHTCSYDGEGSISGDRVRMDAEDGEACRPELQRTGARIDVHDPGGACRGFYCGLRGNFEGGFELDLR